MLEQDQEALVAREPGMSLDQARLVLSHMQVPNEDSLYVLGCFERRVTLRSQQVRALNLICALDSIGALNDRGRIAVVGGGVAGMTAAAGAARLGYKVTLLEKKEQLLPLLRGNNTRWLHPHIYEWPETPGPTRHDRGSLDPDEAGLPLLSWRAGLAGAVADQFDAQWAALPERASIDVVYNVGSIDPGTGRPRFLSWNNPGYRRGTFDAVILAIGFGFEKPFEGVRLVPYWDNDSLHQPTHGGIERYLISGCGDGGLIDLLRLKILNFRHEEVVQRFLSAPGLEVLKNELKDIEDEARRREARGEDPGTYLEERYEHLKVPEEVDKAFDLRKDTEVTLNGRGRSPLTLRASILNRFLASRLIHKYQVVPFRPDEFSATQKGNGYEVRFNTGEPEFFHRIVCRHGPAPGGALGKEFPTILGKCGKLEARNDLDQTRRPLWEPGFFSLGGGLPPSTPRTQPPSASTGDDKNKPVGQAPFIGIPGGSLREGFKGREQALEALHALLRETGKVALTSGTVGPVYAHGGGGMGKSRLAIEYAHRYRHEYPGGVFFAYVGERAPQTIFAECARGVLADMAPSHEDEAALAFVRGLEDAAKGARLIIFDDVQAGSRESLARRFSDSVQVHGHSLWPIPYAHVSLLITTRMREIEREIEGAKSFSVERLDPEAALELLLERARPRAFSPAELPDARRLASGELGGHPLAIRLAGAYVGRLAQLSLAEYLQRLREQGLIDKLEVAKDEVGYTIRDHEQSIAATYELSWQQLDSAKLVDALALRLLAIAAFLAPGTPIDPGLLQRLARASGMSAGLEQIGGSLARLTTDLSLLDSAGPDVIIHPLIAHYTRWRIQERKQEQKGLKRALLKRLRSLFTRWRMQERKLEQKGLQRALLEGMGSLFPPAPDEFWKITRQGAHLGWEHLSGPREAHATAVWNQTRAVKTLDWSMLSRNLGDLSLQRGSLKRARDFYEQALEIRKWLAEKKPENAGWQRNVSAILDRLGYVLSEQGNLQGARQAYEQALEVATRLAEKEPENVDFQRDVSVSLNKLGDVLSRQGNLEDARRAYEQALEIAQRLAENDPEDMGRQRDVSVCLNQLGSVMREQGNLEGAHQAYEQALEIAQRLMDREPENAGWQRDVSVCLNRLGYVLSEQGNLEGARRAYEQDLEIAQRLAEKEPEHIGWQTDFALSKFRVATSLVEGANPDRPRAVRLLTQARDTLLHLAADSRLTHAQQHELLPAIEKLLREWKE